MPAFVTMPGAQGKPGQQGGSHERHPRLWRYAKKETGADWISAPLV